MLGSACTWGKTYKEHEGIIKKVNDNGQGERVYRACCAWLR